MRKSEERTIEALRQSDALKSALISSVSHELRTPLTVMKGMVSSLSSDGERLPESVREEWFDGIREEIDYLTRLVENLLDMSRIEAGALQPKREWHLLGDLIEGAIRRLGTEGKDHPLQVTLDDDLQPVFADAVQLQQVLVNLLDNAIKYSDPGSPLRVESRILPGSVEVSVRSRGPGISHDDLPHLFDRFYRCTHRDRSVRGAGLGLAICKGIIEAHGGTIWVESEPDGETVVRFRLPLGASPPSVASMEHMDRDEGT